MRFELPPSLAKEFERIYAQLDSPELKKLAEVPASARRGDSEQRNKETVDSVIYYLSQKLRDRTPRSLPDKISGLRSLFSIAVTNDGSSAVSEVRLHVPGAEFLRVLGEAQNPAVERKGNVIYLGQMQPKESLKLYVWSSSGSYRYDRLCENSEASKTVEKGNHISPKIDDLIPKSVSFMLQSGTT